MEGDFIMDNYAIHSFKHVSRGLIIWFSTLQLSKIIVLFLISPNVTSVVQPLDQGIITSIKEEAFGMGSLST